VSLLLVVLVPATAGARNGNDVWSPSNWTGEAAGPPVPGTGLPPAGMPGYPVPLPEGFYDVAPTYEGQAQCDPAAKPGTQRLADLIKATYGANQTVWIPRNCDVGGQSEHKEGRALDWMTSARVAQERANAEAFLAWLLGPDQFGVPYGNAMRLGVMYIGWNDRIWRGYDIKRGWTELKGCFATPSPGHDTVCHRNHIHISFTWDGASGRTSFWDGTPMDGPYCATQRATGGVISAGRAAGMTPVAPAKVLGTRTVTGIDVRCRLQQDRWNGDSKRIVVRVLNVAGVPASGVAAVAVNVTAMGSNAPANVRVWSPGEGKSQVVVKVPMNMDATGTAIVPVSTEGTIAFATSAGATDLAVDILGWFPPGDVPNNTEATPGPAVPMGQETAPAPAPPAPVPSPQQDQVDEFISIGSEVGYETAAQGPLQPGEERVVGLAGVPGNATAALVLVTAKDATKRGSLRIGMTPDAAASPALAFRKNGARTAVMVVPVVGGQVRLAVSKRSSLNVRVEVLGYSISAKPVKLRGLKAQRISKGKLGAGETLVLGPITGVASLPRKAKRITGVILQVTTKAKAGEAGTLRVYPLDGAAPATRLAPITPGKPFTTLIASEVSPDGRIVISPTTAARFTVSVVGYVRR
jgi:hypothetical protein